MSKYILHVNVRQQQSGTNEFTKQIERLNPFRISLLAGNPLGVLLGWAQVDPRRIPSWLLWNFK